MKVHINTHTAKVLGRKERVIMTEFMVPILDELRRDPRRNDPTARTYEISEDGRWTDVARKVFWFVPKLNLAASKLGLKPLVSDGYEDLENFGMAIKNFALSF